jgi:putative mycofactocin binding protein MftB
MEHGCLYHLHPAVRGRNEGFGLLFYNTRDTKLTFVRCGDLLRILPAAEAAGMRRVEIHGKDEPERDRARRVLEGLSRKGLIIETGISP